MPTDDGGDMANGSNNGGDNADDGQNGSAGVRKRVKRVRERIQDREQAQRAKRRARTRKRQQRRERVSDTASEMAGLGKDAKRLIATELGVSQSKAQTVIERFGDAVEAVSDPAEQFDYDGDGDTDLLEATEAGRPVAPNDDFGVTTQLRPDLDPAGGEPVADPTAKDVEPTEPVMNLGGLTMPEYSPVDVEEPIDDGT